MADTVVGQVIDKLEEIVPGARRENGSLVLDGDAALEASRRIDAETGEIGYAHGRGRDPRAPFGVPGRREFVDPLFVEKGGNPDSDYAPLVDFLPAPEIAEVARLVIAKYPRRFRHLLPPIDQRVDYLWKRAGGESAGKVTLGKCVKAGTLARHYLRLAVDRQATWVVWIAADHCESIAERQMEALIFHELLHTGMDEKHKPKIRPHDVEEFRAVIEEYGFIFDDLRALKQSVRQRSLFEGDGDDEGEEA